MQLKFKPVIMGGWPRGAGGGRFLPKFEVAKGQLHSLPWSSWLNSGYQLPCASFRCKPRSPRSQWLQTGYYLNSQWITADSAAISKPQNHSLNKMQALCLFNLFFNGGSSRIPALYIITVRNNFCSVSEVKQNVKIFEYISLRISSFKLVKAREEESHSLA